MTIERLAAAVVELAMALGSLPRDTDRDMAHKVTIRGLERGDPTMLEGKKVVEAVVSAYYGANNLGMEVAARELIESVAAGDRAKQFSLAVLDGPGCGMWECVVRRQREAVEPVIVRPDRPKLILPGGG